MKQFSLEHIRPYTVVTGHYGSGKTNLSLNLAVGLAKIGKRVAVVDLDIVNPYFRTSDARGLLESKGIHVISPNFAGSNLDTPSLPAAVDAVFHQEFDHVIFDAGGDDAGAIALGRYAATLAEREYELLYVFNAFRYLTGNTADTIENIRAIEMACRMKVDALVNNSNLGDITSEEDIRTSMNVFEELCRQSSIPEKLTAVKASLAGIFPQAFLIDILIGQDWENNHFS